MNIVTLLGSTRCTPHVAGPKGSAKALTIVQAQSSIE